MCCTLGGLQLCARHRVLIAATLMYARICLLLGYARYYRYHPDLEFDSTSINCGRRSHDVAPSIRHLERLSANQFDYASQQRDPKGSQHSTNVSSSHQPRHVALPSPARRNGGHISTITHITILAPLIKSPLVAAKHRPAFRVQPADTQNMDHLRRNWSHWPLACQESTRTR